MHNNEYFGKMLTKPLNWPFPSKLEENYWALDFRLDDITAEVLKLSWKLENLNNVIADYLSKVERINKTPRLISTRFGPLSIKELKKRAPELRLIERIFVRPLQKHSAVLSIVTDGDPLEFHFWPAYSVVLKDLQRTSAGLKLQGVPIDKWDRLHEFGFVE